MVVQDHFCDIQPQTAPSAVPVPGFVHPVEKSEGTLQIDIGVGRFCGRLDGKTGQHQRSHNQQERKQRKSLSLLPYRIEESPFTQIHFLATSFPSSKTSGFTCVPPNVFFRRDCFSLRWYSRLPGTPLWYTTKVEFRWS